MSCGEAKRRVLALPVEWEKKRDARRQLLAKVRARRRMAMRDRTKNNARKK